MKTYVLTKVRLDLDADRDLVIGVFSTEDEAKKVTKRISNREVVWVDESNILGLSLVSNDHQAEREKFNFRIEEFVVDRS